MRFLTAAAIVTTLMFFANCDKNKFYHTSIETYQLNPSYNGNHRSDFELNYYLKEEKEGVQIQVLLNNIEANLANDYNVSLHKTSTSGYLGFETQATIDIGNTTSTTNGAAAVYVSKMSWNAIKDFDGYLVVQDPANLGIDSVEQ